MAFTHISKIIGKTTRHLGLERQARAGLVCEKYRQLALEILDQKTLLHARPKYYRGKTLVISVDHPVFASRIMRQKDIILGKLNEFLGRDIVKNIRTVIEKHIIT